MAVDVAPTEYIQAEDFDAEYKIALHHGAVNTAKTDIGYQISNEHVTTELFKGHDLTLLGDIHKPNQILQSYSYEEIEVDETEVDEYLKDGWEIQ
jgi:hypothetical protein